MRTLNWLLLPALLAASGCITHEKSSNPLSPTVAGPIPGVAITAPDPVSPGQGVRIAVDQQPLVLALDNATTSGVRPLSYVFEVAADPAFATKVFVREGVTPGEHGRTTLRLPDALASGRTYYWRAKAADGANTGPYSYTVMFHIFTPIVIGSPAPRAPSGAVPTQQPTFILANAPRSGPAGAIIYRVEIAGDPSFASMLAVWIVNEQPGETRLLAPSPLPAGQQLFWRARATEASTEGGWSQALAFTTAAPAAPDPGGGGGSCSWATGSSPLATLQGMRKCYPTPMSHDQKGALMNRVAWAHRTEGWGLHLKEGGNRCPQPGGVSVSCDILVHQPTQRYYDVLLNEDEDAIPTWPAGGSGTIGKPSWWVAPRQP